MVVIFLPPRGALHWGSPLRRRVVRGQLYGKNRKGALKAPEIVKCRKVLVFMTFFYKNRNFSINLFYLANFCLAFYPTNFSIWKELDGHLNAREFGSYWRPALTKNTSLAVTNQFSVDKKHQFSGDQKHQFSGDKPV